MYVHVIFQSYYGLQYIYIQRSLYHPWYEKSEYSNSHFLLLHFQGETHRCICFFLYLSHYVMMIYTKKKQKCEKIGKGLITNTCKALIDYQQPLSFLLTFFAWTAELISIVSRMHSYVPTKIWISNKSKVSLTAWVQNVFDKSLPTLKRLMLSQNTKVYLLSIADMK